MGGLSLSTKVEKNKIRFQRYLPSGLGFISDTGERIRTIK